MTWAPRWPLSSRGRIGGHREAGLFPVERSRKQLACALEGPQPPRASLEVVSGVRCPVQCLAHSRGSIDIRWDKGGAFLGSSVSGVCASSQAGCCGGSRGVLWAFSSGLCEMPLLWMRWCGGAGGTATPRPSLGEQAAGPSFGGVALQWCSDRGPYMEASAPPSRQKPEGLAAAPFAENDDSSQVPGASHTSPHRGAQPTEEAVPIWPRRTGGHRPVASQVPEL